MSKLHQLHDHYGQSPWPAARRPGRHHHRQSGRGARVMSLATLDPGALRLDEPPRPASSDAAGRDRGPYPPIGDYALLSDCHSAALVSRDGSIDWCCFHRFDARPVFARLLDWSGGGHFRVAPTGPYAVSRRYLPATNVLETRFVTPSGVLTVVDCLAVRRGAVAGDAAQTRSHHQLLRLVRCDAGQVQVSVEFAPASTTA